MLLQHETEHCATIDGTILNFIENRMYDLQVKSLNISIYTFLPRLVQLLSIYGIFLLRITFMHLGF
jgi:hypothetical protein